jgi:hypothetical protein
MRAGVDFASILLLLLAVLVVSGCTFALHYAGRIYWLSIGRKAPWWSDPHSNIHQSSAIPRKRIRERDPLTYFLVSLFANIPTAESTVRNAHRGRSLSLIFCKYLMIATANSGLRIFTWNCLHRRYNREHWPLEQSQRNLVHRWCWKLSSSVICQPIWYIPLQLCKCSKLQGK